jgi:hypothetical protein
LQAQGGDRGGVEPARAEQSEVEKAHQPGDGRARREPGDDPRRGARQAHERRAAGQDEHDPRAEPERRRDHHEPIGEARGQRHDLAGAERPGDRHHAGDEARERQGTPVEAERAPFAKRELHQATVHEGPAPFGQKPWWRRS